MVSSLGCKMWKFLLIFNIAVQLPVAAVIVALPELLVTGKELPTTKLR